MDLTKIKKEIENLDINIKKTREEYLKIKSENRKGVSMKKKIELNNLKTEITKLSIERDKKVYEYHNYFNPFAVLFVLIILFGGVFSIQASSNFEINQTETAISELFSNYSNYIRSGQDQRIGVYIEPIAGRTINEITFIINGCGYTDEISNGIEGEEPNIIYTKILHPNITQNTDDYGQNERCLLTVNVSVIDSEYFTFEKTLTHYVGYPITGCEYNNSCTVIGNYQARGYYYYDNINMSGTLTLTNPSNTNRRAYGYFVTKGYFIQSGTISLSGINSPSCTYEDGQSGGTLYVYSPYIELNTITGNGGNGQSCSGIKGGEGGQGARLYLYSGTETVLKGNIQLNGGAGANGGFVSSGSSGTAGGDGGHTGELYLYSLSNTKPIVRRISGTTTFIGGNAGNGRHGNAGSNCRRGGKGGEGGDISSFFFYDINYIHLGGGTYTFTSGDGGNAGDSHCPSSGNDAYRGSDGGDAGKVDWFTLNNSNINITANMNFYGGDGGYGGDADCVGYYSASGGNGGDADNIDQTYGNYYGDYYQSSVVTIQGGKGGQPGTGACGGSYGSYGCKGGCRYYGDVSGPNFDVGGKYKLTNTLQCLIGSTGKETGCISQTAVWKPRINSTQEVVGNDFTNLLPARVTAEEYMSSLNTIGTYSEITVQNFTIREKNFTSDVYSTIPGENTTLFNYFLMNISNDLPIIELEEYQSFSGYKAGEYYILFRQCLQNGKSYYCTENNSNVFTLSYISTNLSGNTSPTNLINLTQKEFGVYCSYYIPQVGEFVPAMNIAQANVRIEINNTENVVDYDDGLYYYINDKVFAAGDLQNITCKANKRDYIPQELNVGELSFTEIIVEMPYGNPQTICLFPNQKNVIPTYQTALRPIMKIINLGNETINLTTSFNHTLPSSITHGIINDAFSYNWNEYVILNTTPQLFKTNLNYYDGTQNTSNYSVSAWLLTNCTNANPGETIITYEGDYVFIRSD